MNCPRETRERAELLVCSRGVTRAAAPGELRPGTECESAHLLPGYRPHHPLQELSPPPQAQDPGLSPAPEATTTAPVSPTLEVARIARTISPRSCRDLTEGHRPQHDLGLRPSAPGARSQWESTPAASAITRAEPARRGSGLKDGRGLSLYNETRIGMRTTPPVHTRQSREGDTSIRLSDHIAYAKPR